MPFKEATFILSAPDLSFCPDNKIPEICFAGRSNVGKSTLINAICNRKRLAKTSNTPGKTRTLNYFLIDNQFHLVDLPGYGFAKVSKSEKKDWGESIQKYLLEREQLNMVYQLIDIRHEPTKLDQDFMLWLASSNIPFCQVLTKADKLKHNKQQQSKARLKRLQKEINIEVPIIMTSAMSKNGMDELTNVIHEFLDLPEEK